MNKETIIIATIKEWNLLNAEKFKQLNKDKIDTFIIDKKEDLNFESLKKIKPSYIFFPHWSYIISKSIYQNFECIVFHMTDLPYGRGGSPLQNLIVNKVYNTKISAIRVDEGIDTGKIYLKEAFYIGLGSAQEIYQKMSEIIFFKMIPYILKNKPEPQKQIGNTVEFKRRKPEQSDISLNRIENLDDFYNFIRMLDADTYPRAFLSENGFKIEFLGVCKKTGKLEGRFEITKED